MTPIS